MKKRREKRSVCVRLLTAALCLTLLGGLLPPGEVLAAAISPYSQIETLADGTVIQTNKNGSKTITFSAANSTAEEDADEYDRLVPVGDQLVGENSAVKVQVEDTYQEQETLVQIEKDGMVISFTPVGLEPTAGIESEAATGMPSGGMEDSADAVEEADLDGEDETAKEMETVEEASLIPEEEETVKEVETVEEASFIPEEEETLPEDVLETLSEVVLETSSEETGSMELVGVEESELSEASAPAESVVPEVIPGEGLGFNGTSYEAVEYTGVFAENTTIHLEARKYGIKEDIIIESCPEEAGYSYDMKLTGLTPDKEGNQILLLDSDGIIQGEIAAPFLIDANGAMSTDIEVELVNQGGDSYRLTYRPSITWLQEEGRAYPVVLDPPVTFHSNVRQQVEDNYITLENPSYHHNHNDPSLLVGNDGQTHIAYIRPAIPEDIKALLGRVLIAEASVHIYEKSGRGSDQTFSLYPIIGGEWSSDLLTAGNAPLIASLPYGAQEVQGGGWFTWDIKSFFSGWFNAMNQLPNYGFALIADQGRNGDWRRFASADDPDHGLTFEVTYYEVDQDTNLTLTPSGNGVNSGTGYVTLNWNAIEGAETYLLGIFNGKDYEYFNIGNVTSYSTKDKKLWPTQTEIGQGRYELHHDGQGTDLPMIPAFTYGNAGTAYASDLQYHFRIVPANSFEQVPFPQSFALRSTKLPDTMPPNRPQAVTVDPSEWTNAAAVKVSWAGVTDYNNSAGGAAMDLGMGRIQYAFDDPNDASRWRDTDQNTASGSYHVPTAGLADGTHVVYIRGKDAAGNTGSPNYASFKIDKTGPLAPTLHVQPEGWTKSDAIRLSWSGMEDLQDLLRVEYSFDGGAYVATGRTEKAYTGWELNISALSSGVHTLTVRGVDKLGNVGANQTISIYKDQEPPTVAAVTVEPASWTKEQEVEIFWQTFQDAHSGIHGISYRVDGGVPVTLPEVSEDGRFVLDISALEDGEHTVAVTFQDALGNEIVMSVPLYRDSSDPVITILSPADGDLVAGTMEILGSVQDLSLLEWKLYAAGEDGIPVPVASGTENANDTLLGILNTNLFADGEKITITLEAEDAAGNRTETSGIVIKVDKSARLVGGDVKITAPTNGSVIRTESTDGRYQSTRPETDSYVYIDSMYQGSGEGQQFSFDAVTYDEGSTHSISVITRDQEGGLQYSDGLYAVLLLSDVFQDESFTSSKAGITYTQMGAALSGGQNGEISAITVTAPKNILALRLRTTEQIPVGTSIRYEVSLDGGITYEEIMPGVDQIVTKPAQDVMLRAVFAGNGSETPVLYGWDLEAVVEIQGTKVVSRLMKDIQNLILTVPERVRTSYAELQAAYGSKQGAQPVSGDAKEYLYVDGILHGDLLTYDALTADEKSSHSISTLAEDGLGTLYASGQNKTRLLLRENVSSGAFVEGVVTRVVRDGTPLQSVRLMALAEGGSGNYFYSLDGEQWIAITPGENIFLSRRVSEIYWKAELSPETTMLSWHVEGSVAADVNAYVQIMDAPIQLTAADWGTYYEHKDLKKYEITWSDPNPVDPTSDSATVYRLYKNGSLLEETSALRYTDEEYQKDAVYTVEAVRRYPAREDHHPKHFETRISDPATAASYTLPAKPVVEGVQYNPVETAQSEYINDLYGGNYTFSDHLTPPSGAKEVDQKLLGRSTRCAYGFEPINFNTGNFLLESADYEREDQGSSKLVIFRTYNAKADMVDGPFGAKWQFAYSEHLIFYKGGDIGYQRGDGSIINFRKQADGTYQGNDDDYLQFAFGAEGTEYQITEKDGTVTAFTTGGLLKSVTTQGGRVTSIERDENGLMTGIIAPSGAALLVTMDENGHITQLQTPDGGVMQYMYEGRFLTSFTDAAGFLTRYEYDDQGRMTAWYDSEDVQQVNNRYDSENRVIWQRDGDGGEYTLEYFSDHTVTTDAEGVKCEIWFDEEKRTTRMVDGTGQEISYAWEEEMTSCTASDGSVHIFEYDEQGNKIKDAAPDGSMVSMEYDAKNQLVSLTDQIGNITRYEYDEAGNKTKEIYADETAKSWAYNKDGKLTEEVDELGGKTSYLWEGLNLVRKTDALGNPEDYEYDEAGRLTAEINCLGYRTEYEYNEGGNVVKTINPDGSILTYGYDSLHQLTVSVDESSRVTRYEYDNLRRLTAIVRPDGSREETEYTASGQAAKVIDPLGNETVYEYDGNGNKTLQRDPEGNTNQFVYDEQGRVTREILPTGAEVLYTYDLLSGMLASMTDEYGVTILYEYDPAGNLIREEATGGAVTTREYDSRNRIVSETDPSGGVTRYEYDACGNILSITLPGEIVTHYAYDASGNIVKVTDALGQVISYQYDALGNQIRETDPEGAVTAYIYDNRGRVVEKTDASGGIHLYEYDADGLLRASTDPAGNQESYERDEEGRITATVTKNGNRITAAYDANGNLLQMSDATGSVSRFEYSPAGRVVKATDAAGEITGYSYDAFGNLTRSIAPDGNTQSFVYNGAGQLVRQVDEGGSVVESTYDVTGRLATQIVDGEPVNYRYDAAGHLTEFIDQAGNHTAMSYDEAGRLAEVLYADGRTYQLEYDALGRLVKSKDPVGMVTAYTYNAKDLVTSETVNGQTTWYEYDLLGYLVREVQPDGRTTGYEYDRVGNLIQTTDPSGLVNEYTYDAEGNLIGVQDSAGRSAAGEYDVAGRLIAESDALGNRKTYGYNAAGQLTAVTDALANTTCYRYSAGGLLTGITDALGNVTHYEYDERGYLTKEIDALGNETSYVRDREGRVLTRTDAAGDETGYTYDGVGNLTRIEYADGRTVTNTYTTSGTTAVAEEKGQKTTYQYDRENRLISVAYSGGDMVSYEYDEAGNKTAVVYPDGSRVSYEYDTQGQLILMTGLDGLETVYEYDGFGRRSKTEGLVYTESYEYDVAGNLCRLRIQDRTNPTRDITLTYRYDENNRQIEETREEGTNTRTNSYSYDAAGQLIRWRQEDHAGDGQIPVVYEEQYTYDAAGNMVETIREGESIHRSYNALNQLIESEEGEEKTTYTYDVRGNLTEKNVNGQAETYTYGAGNVLTAHEKSDGSSEEYTYDALGLLREAARETEGRINTTRYYFDLTEEYPELLYEITTSQNEAGEQSREIIRLHEYGLERIASYTGTGPQDEKTEYLYDGGGSVIREICHLNSWSNYLYQKQDAESFAYNPWGVKESYLKEETGIFSLRSSQSESRRTSFGYQGEMCEEDSGSIYLRARWYEPEMERFNQKDLVAGDVTEPISLNRYLYVLNDPVDREDAGGLLSTKKGGLVLNSNPPVPAGGSSSKSGSGNSARNGLYKVTEDVFNRATSNDTTKYTLKTATSGTGNKSTKAVSEPKTTGKSYFPTAGNKSFAEMYEEIKACDGVIQNMPAKRIFNSANGGTSKNVNLTSAEWNTINKGELPLDIANPYESQVFQWQGSNASGCFEQEYYINGQRYTLKVCYLDGKRVTFAEYENSEYIRTQGVYKRVFTEEEQFWAQVLVAAPLMLGLGYLGWEFLSYIGGQTFTIPLLQAAQFAGGGALSTVTITISIPDEIEKVMAVAGAWATIKYFEKNIPSEEQARGDSSKGDGETQSKSRINENDRLAKEAEKMGKDPKVQKEADELIEQYKNGNTNPGLGSKHLQGDIYYLRGRNGARVFYRMKDGVMEILGKASKSNEQTVIDLVIEIFGK